MLKWIARKFGPGNELTECLDTPKGLRRFIAQLEAQRSEQVLQSVTNLFAEAPRLGLAPQHLLRALNQLDVLARSHRNALSARLLDDSPKQIVSQGIWTLLSAHYRSLHDGYRHCIGLLGSDANPTEHDHVHAIVFACRAMAALAKHNMLLRMCYRDRPSEIWAQMAALAAWSRTRSQTSATVDAWPGEATQTSVEREYQIGLLSEMAPTDNLLPAQTHAVDLLLRRHAEHYVFSDSYDEASSPFALEAGGKAKPSRWLKGLSAKPGMRFFGLGAAYHALAAEHDQAAKARSAPDWLAPSQVGLEHLRTLLERLLAHWSRQPPTRRHRREPGEGEILVAHDFAHIRRLIGFSELARAGRSLEYDRFSAYAINSMVRSRDALDLQPTSEKAVSAEEAVKNLQSFERALEQEATETWKLVDASEQGLGAEVIAKGAWAKAGMLIAYRRPDSAVWSMAIVRRLSRGKNDNLRIGLSKLAGAPCLARVSINADKAGNGALQATGPAVHYDAILLRAAELCLLLPPGVFDRNWHYTLTVGTRWDPIQMDRCTECGLDFERIEFAVAKSQRAA